MFFRRLLRIAIVSFGLLPAAQAQSPPKKATDAQSTVAAEPRRLLVGLRLPAAHRAEDELAVTEATAQRARIAAAQDDVAAAIGRLGGRVDTRYRLLPYLAVELDAARVPQLAALPAVASITADRLRRPALLRSTALIGADVAWRQGLTGAGWTVAVPDTGIDSAHPFLAGKVVAEACFSSNWGGHGTQPATVSLCPGGLLQADGPGAARPCDSALADCEHGTHVAGIVAGRDGPRGLTGVAPEATLIALQIYSRLADGAGIGAWDSDLLAALERVHELGGRHRIAAVNLSLAGDDLFSEQAACDAAHPALKDAVALLRSAGIVTIAAAGNDGASEALAAPACLSGVIGVGAVCTGRDDGFCAGGVDSVAAYSNVAPFLGLLAPGSGVTSAVPGGYDTFSGTSLAAPHASGAMALLKQMEPTIPAAKALDALREMAARVDDTRAGGKARDLALLDVSGLARSPVVHGAATSPPGSAPSVSTTRTATAPMPPARAGATSGGSVVAAASVAAAGGAPESAANPLALTTATVPLAAGQGHTCAVTPGGAARCWGGNTYGQLGNGNTSDQSMPVDVLGLASDVTAMTAGRDHSCALTSGGAARCWGKGQYGRLGDGNTFNRLAPVDVSGLSSGVAAIVAGEEHTCALTTGGAVKCWGRNIRSQLGNGGVGSQSTTPVDVSGLGSGIAAIAAGNAHSCALTTAGGVKCWGGNEYGQLGNGNTDDQATPVDVGGLASGVAAIAAGAGHTCALMTGGGVKCWGRNDSGQVGNGTNNFSQPTPVNVTGLASGVVAIAAGFGHVCAINGAGGARCWGENGSGQLGDGGIADQSTPVDVSGLASGVEAIAAGWAHTCAVVGAGAVKCWGYNETGQLGNGRDVRQPMPEDVVGMAGGATVLDAGISHSCAVSSGGARCWGANTYGQLGDGSTVDRATPVDVGGLSSGFASLAAGGSHTCALTGSGGARCWGRNNFGQLGDGSTGDQPTPVNVSGMASGVSAITAGWNHSCAVASGGAARCWGYNAFGQLGNGGTTMQTAPIAVSGLASGVQAISGGDSHTCAVTSGGGVKCWGYNGFGQLGNGTFVNQSTPVDVSDLASGAAAVATGDHHSCVLTDAGAVRCWGWNASGQLGNGSMSNRSTPVNVTGLGSGVAAIAAGAGHTCALMTGGAVKCWGRNNRGQLGDGSSVQRTTPVDVIGLGSGVAAVAAGGEHTCALTTGGAVKCWGYKRNGQVGNGEFAYAPLPVDVTDLLPATDTTPDPFGFTTQTGVLKNQPITSNTIVPAGYDSAAAISVANGEYSIGCTGTFTSTAASISPGQSVCVRHTSSNSLDTSVTTTLTIGGISGTFTSTTTPYSFIGSPGTIDFDGHSMFTPSVARTVTLQNLGVAGLPITAMTPNGPFEVKSQTCGALPAVLPIGASCVIQIVFRPPGEGPFNGFLQIDTGAGSAVVQLLGIGERSLVMHYYASILNRLPDPGGKPYWNGEATRVQALGADLNEVWYAMAISFFSSVEYVGFNRSDSEFVDDLYRTFLNREADAAGKAFWLSQFAAGLTREVVLVAFMFSDEFRQFTASIFGNTAVRKELDAVMDFYRGLLFRLPDGGGFNFWVSRFRTAQCAGSAAVTAEAEAISGEFARGAEYANRNRSNSEYVGDLYNAILRRGGDGPGVQFWINSIASGVLTREQVRQQFVLSPEFQGRVAQIIAAGCLP